jgi:pyruvate dehydrogenase E2 component (dihydrolipoamide acetyltransferase)
MQASLSSGGSASTAAAPAAAAPVAAAAPAATGGGSAPNVDFEEVFMPALSSTMTEGKIVAWSVKPGDKVKEGDELMVVESDKVGHVTSPTSLFTFTH